MVLPDKQFDIRIKTYSLYQNHLNLNCGTGEEFTLPFDVPPILFSSTRVWKEKKKLMRCIDPAQVPGPLKCFDMMDH